jgi:tRNA(Ile)-lysidine synthase
MTNRLTEQVLKTIRHYEMLERGDSVVLAVSGGPDSVFLLEAISALKNKSGIKKISVCNLDHGLRGDESTGDSLFVKDLARSRGLEFIHKKIDLNRTKLKSISTEEAAREARYRFFRESAEHIGANVIATGHTIDDQAETVLMRIVKGASLKGLVGISPAREDGDFRIIRPLIEIEKQEIVKYLDGRGIPYRIDSTNREPIYFRNVVRKDVIPFLERYNPRLKRAMFNLAEHLREDFEFISDEKKKAASSIRSSGKGELVIRLKDIAVQPKAIQKEIMRDALGKIGGEVKKLSFRHWKELEAVIRRGRKGCAVHLPGGIRVARTGDSINFSRL